MLVFGITSLLYGLIIYNIENNILCPAVLFNYWWGGIALFDCLDILHLYPVSNDVLTIICVGSFVFNFTYIVSGAKNGKIRVSKDKGSALQQFPENEFNNIKLEKILFWVQLFLLLTMIPMLIKIIPQYSKVNLATLRSSTATGIFDDGSTYMSTGQRLFYIHWFVYPLAKTLFTFSIILWMMSRIRLRVFVVALLNIISIFIMSGSRTTLFFAALITVFAFAALKKKKKKVISNKKRRYIYFVVILAIYFMAKNGLERSVNANDETLIGNLFSSVVGYFSAGLHLFTNILYDKSRFQLDQLSFGILSTRGIWGVVSQVCYYASFGLIPLLGRRFSIDCLAPAYPIGPTRFFNAFPTMYYYFMRDFGYFGIIFFTALFAFICQRVYKKYLATSSVISLCFLLETAFTIIYSTCWWTMHKQEYFMELVYFFIIYHWIKQRGRETT
jgi:oligosaccharide repeat unit polymerase